MDASEESIGSRSRRPHTKSRKGCRTCKRRHIRCDEATPQCQNCVKHNCFCDFVEQSSADVSHPQASTTDLIWTPEIDALLDEWQRTGICSIGGTAQVDLSSLDHKYTKNELLLVHHCLTMEREPLANTYTVWTGLSQSRGDEASISNACNFLLLWNINDIRITSIGCKKRHVPPRWRGGLAINGLQNAIGHFSEHNGDAILAASMLLSWQAHEWQSWKSLIVGIRTVVTAMRSWKPQSLFPELITEFEMAIPENFAGTWRMSTVDSHIYKGILNRIQIAFAAIQHLFYNREAETMWILQIQEYFLHLRDVKPTFTPTEQFDHLHPYRKWLFWIPTNTLKSHEPDKCILVLLAHLYAAALAIEPLYPNVAPAFSSLLVIRPLREIIQKFRGLEESAVEDSHISDLLRVMEFPKQIAHEYQNDIESNAF